MDALRAASVMQSNKLVLQALNIHYSTARC